ncbi:MAG: sigma-54 factor interaction domain-containing protein, partial [Gammaproteobacteria bacterium]|nr:sigma-54 factor interaction domain-containing protein [Gammaproteobacteria bacterium]
KDACGVATEDPDMLRLIHRLTTVAASEASVLLQGESGTGKTELARLVHRRSQRCNKPFVEINCGAIPSTLIETELFGHVKGAFTGAVKDREGRFKAADGGTLFLDEIGELPRELQPKLLRVLQDGEYEPVGSDRTLKVDVRLVCASNRDLHDLVDNGLFRADLYYRIAVVPLQVPPLRERPGDISLLTKVIHKRLVMRNYPAETTFSDDAMRAI